jgi:hypothetical protein
MIEEEMALDNEEPLVEWERELLDRPPRRRPTMPDIEEETATEQRTWTPMPVKRKYKIEAIPEKNMAGEEFEAPHGWDLFCLWSDPDGVTYGIFEKVEDA